MDFEPLPPERRFRLYMRLHESFRKAGAHRAAEAAWKQAQKATAESPAIRQEFRDFLEKMRKEGAS